MKRLILVAVVLVLSGAVGLYGQGPGGGGMGGQRGSGGQRGGGPQMSGPQRGPQQGPMQQQQQRQQSRTHECEQWCTKARQEARHLERYCDKGSFEPATARQLGRQLEERLQAMETHHAALRERLSPAERDQHRKRLEAMEQSQQRWRESFGALDAELEKDAPSRAVLRRHARAIDKELGKFSKEMHALEDASSD